jgi:hypothetical protein
LYNFFCRDVNYFPTLEIIAEFPDESNKIIILFGFIGFSRNTSPDINSIFGDKEPFEVFYREQIYFKVDSIYNMMIMQKHGIEYTLFEITLEKNKQTVIKQLLQEEDDSIILLSTHYKKEEELKDFLIDFPILNPLYVQELCYIGDLYFDFTS